MMFAFLLRQARTALGLGAALCVLPLAGAQAGGSKPGPGNDPFAIPDPLNERLDVSTDNLFGFTDGTDTNNERERDFTFDVITRVGKRAVTTVDGNDGGKGRFVVTAIKTGVQYGVTDAFSIETSVFGDLRSVRGVPDITDKSAFNFNGASLEFKYRLLERTPDNPIGFAVLVEPQVGLIADQEGTREKAFSLESKLLLDARLLPGRLWYGASLGFEHQAGRFATGVGERQSILTASNALALRVLDHTYVGLDIRYQRSYNGLFAQALTGEAAFVGPTFYQEFSKGAFLSAAWAVQAWGRQHDPVPLVAHKLDLWNFERNLVRVKMGFHF